MSDGGDGIFGELGRTADRDLLAAWLVDAIPQWQQQTLGPVRELEGGWESDIYQFDVTHGRPPVTERLVLRRYVGDGAVALGEFKGMQRLHQADYPVPEVIAVEPAAVPLGRPFMVMRFVPGNGHRSWTEITGPEMLPNFVRLLSKLHSIDWRPFAAPLDQEGLARGGGVEQTMQEWHSYMARHPIASFEPLTEWLEGGLATLERRPPAVVHWDFHPGNILLTEAGEATVVDWTQITVTDPRFDVAWTALLIAMAVDGAARDRFLNEYHHQAGELANMEFFTVAAAFKRLYSVTASLAAGPEALGMRAEAADRMRRDIHTLALPHADVTKVTGITIPDVADLLDGG